MKDTLKFRHRYIILCHPNKDNKIAIVNFTGQRADKDQTVIFSPSDWSEFDKPTVVNYGSGRLVDLSKVIQHLQNNPNLIGISCPSDITREVIAGAFKSPHTPNKILDLLRSDPQL